MSAIYENSSVFEAFLPSYRSSRPDDLQLEILDWNIGLPVLRSKLKTWHLSLQHNLCPLVRLLRYFSVPSAFLDEHIQSVTHSFGAADLDSGFPIDEEVWIADPRPDGLNLPQWDGTWFQSAFFLRWSVPEKDTQASSQVTMLCLQAPESLRRSLLRLPVSVLCASEVQDPHSLLVVVLKELSHQMADTTWDMADVFS
ncbi:hypothetical protein ASPZODRAFT_16300 [Penicilliopsis zonata CBS 506.65]|uniref:Uncharacterized protein n=1 Tax=Penicilliopsis zonata CBS 506.65 TaxID=1073090 RepID=A0A1L9SHG7_9EURO|nr:hypothetical protein ASPZODRAFT_16300 [Penicilliopsis zonata CBS 506.65]OJJ46546.1 hypothetical protein ASPZODRAFT_16300 [Penicilliopsis zonata CBS 506.65]